MLGITFVGVIQVLGFLAAFYLGKMVERPKEKWPKGSLLKGGWEAMKIPLIVILALAFVITVFLPVINAKGGLLRALGIGGMFSSFPRIGGGYPRTTAGYGGGGYSSGYGSSGYGGGGGYY